MISQVYYLSRILYGKKFTKAFLAQLAADRIIHVEGQTGGIQSRPEPDGQGEPRQDTDPPQSVRDDTMANPEPPGESGSTGSGQIHNDICVADGRTSNENKQAEREMARTSDTGEQDVPGAIQE